MHSFIIQTGKFSANKNFFFVTGETRNHKKWLQHNWTTGQVHAKWKGLMDTANNAVSAQVHFNNIHSRKSSLQGWLVVIVELSCQQLWSIVGYHTDACVLISKPTEWWKTVEAFIIFEFADLGQMIISKYFSAFAFVCYTSELCQKVKYKTLKSIYTFGQNLGRPIKDWLSH